MERWLPLFEIFLHSPSPEGDASLWLQSCSASRPGTTFALLSLLLLPTSATPPPPPSSSSSSSSSSNIFLQTLPPAVQCRILSFLTIEHRRFTRERLRSLAEHVLGSNGASSSSSSSSSTHELDFWVRKAAHHLLDAVSSLSAEDFRDGKEQMETEDEFYAVPQWLKDSGFATMPPIAQVVSGAGVLRGRTCRRWKMDESKPMDIGIDHEEDAPQRGFDLDLWPSSSASASSSPAFLDSQNRDRALTLKAELLASQSVAEVVHVTQELRQLCLDSGARNALAILELAEPWETDDEMAPILLSNLTGSENGLIFSGWPAYVLCSVALPKFLSLQRPASRALVLATIAFCKCHPLAAVEAILFPLAFRKDGVNATLCDVFVRIIKECLHPAHVSASCQRLLCGNEERMFVCLPCHRELIADELVWTESLFMLFQQILNLDIPLTPDTADRLVSVIDKMAEKLSRSLKFGNFMLCFVTKCVHASSIHKSLLERAAVKTNTFVTKSILSKLSGP